MLRIDVHQHLWSEPLVAALGARTRPPYVRRNGRIWELTVPGEPVCTIDVDGDAVDNREALIHLDGLDVAMISLSTVLGIERLPRDEAQPVLDGYHAALDALPRSFAGWAALAWREATPADVDELLDRGYGGISLPAGALASPAHLDRIGPLLERIERRSAALFVHPGPDPFGPAPVDVGGPAWFPALTSYVASLNAAWHTFVATGRRQLPALRIVFAMLAGAAPLHFERLAARGGPSARASDPGIYYDTSSYGSHAITAMARVVGIDQLLHGSDRPVVAPPPAPGPLGAAAWEAMTRTNPSHLFAARNEAVAA